jgi:hypothetical protein
MIPKRKKCPIPTATGTTYDQIEVSGRRVGYLPVMHRGSIKQQEATRKKAKELALIGFCNNVDDGIISILALTCMASAWT